MEPGNIDQAAEFRLPSNRDEGQRIARDKDNLFGEQESELAWWDRERFSLAELANRYGGWVDRLIVGRHINFRADGKRIGSAIYASSIERIYQRRDPLSERLSAPEHARYLRYRYVLSLLPIVPSCTYA